MFALEIWNGSREGWVRCETDGVEARFDSRADAETEGRWSLDRSVACWRAVEVKEVARDVA